MKNVIILLVCTLCIFTGVAQSDLIGNALIVPERSLELEALYQQAKDLEENGTAVQINANRLAIKNAWQQIAPNVAALYKPIFTNKTPETEENLHINGVYIPDVITQRDLPTYVPEDWGVDKLLMYEFVDGGVDVDVTAGGDIYISAFQNNIENNGETYDKIIIFKSTNGGNSFTEWQRVNVTAPMRKLQLITMDGSGDNYLLAYLVTSSKTFQVWRWNIATGDMTAEVIASDVIDFSVDRNYPTTTSTQRVLAMYQKSSHSTYSARSTAGSHGFDWVDEFSLGIVGEQIDFAYGINGSCYTAFIGFSSRGLRANVNNNYNDPAAWGTNESITDGSLVEVINPTIRAARLATASDKVVVWASQRPKGSADGFNGLGLLRQNGAPYVNFTNFSAGGTDWSIAHTDGWIRKENGAEEIRFSYVRDNIPNVEIDSNRSITFNGTDFNAFEPVGDISLNIWDGFPSATAETNDRLACMAFAGTSNDGLFGAGLYFDAKTVLSIDENSFSDFKFYPNPTQDVLNLSANNTIESVSIFSILGEEVIDINVNQNSSIINIESLNPGIYILKVMMDGKSSSYKIIKQ